MIPKEAIATAAQAIKHCEDRDSDALARAALEAATQYVMADAWAQGHEAGFWNGRMTLGDASDVALIGKGHADATNPYKSTP